MKLKKILTIPFLVGIAVSSLALTGCDNKNDEKTDITNSTITDTGDSEKTNTNFQDLIKNSVVTETNNYLNSEEGKAKLNSITSECVTSK